MRKIVLALIFLGLMFCNMGNASGELNIADINFDSKNDIGSLIQQNQNIPIVDSTTPKLSDIQGDIPIALQQAGVVFNGLKADKQRYQDAIATDGTGNPLMITDTVGLPYFMSDGAIPYNVPWSPTKQSQNALVDGKAVYNNPDGTQTSIPLALIVDQKAFHIWYKSEYANPFIVLR